MQLWVQQQAAASEKCDVFRQHRTRTLIRQTLQQIPNIQFVDETWQQSMHTASSTRWAWSEISDRSGTADVPCICNRLYNSVSRFYITAVAFSSTSRYRPSSHHCAECVDESRSHVWHFVCVMSPPVSKYKTAFYGRNFNHDYNYYLHSNKLDKVKLTINEVLLFDDWSSTNCFNFHREDKINKAYSVLGLIKRNFIYLTEYAFVSLYKSLVRCHLEYANSISIWNPDRQGQIRDLEKVQMRATIL